MNLPNIKGLFEHVDSKVESFLVFEGKEYEIQGFQIFFGQEIDHKGQPQAKTKGGQFSLTLTESIDDAIYDWAKRPGKLKSGSVKFVTDSSGTVLQVDFINAACISLTRKINSFSGTETMMVVSSDKISLYEITHDNRWKL